MLKIYNSFTRKKDEFKPLEEGKVKMYVCGPTVYGPPHVGHARSYVNFDIINHYKCSKNKICSKQIYTDRIIFFI